MPAPGLAFTLSARIGWRKWEAESKCGLDVAYRGPERRLLFTQAMSESGHEPTGRGSPLKVAFDPTRQVLRSFLLRCKFNSRVMEPLKISPQVAAGG